MSLWHNKKCASLAGNCFKLQNCIPWKPLNDPIIEASFHEQIKCHFGKVRYPGSFGNYFEI